MIIYKLIKKEVTHFFRNKTNVFTMFIFPVVLILVMGSALNNLMNVDKNIFEDKKIYYKINTTNDENKTFSAFYNFVNLYEKEVKINFIQIYDEEKAKSEVNKKYALAFIKVNDDNFEFYRSEKDESNAQKILKNLFEEYINQYYLTNNLAIYNPSKIIKIINEESLIDIKEEGISNNGISSFTYYTFVEMVLIILYISTITSVSFYEESFHKTLLRLKVSKISNLSILISKIMIGIIIGLIQVVVIYFVSNVFLKVSWGDNIFEVFVVLISFIIFSSVLGICASIIFKDSKTTSSVLNTFIIVLGFLGGSYVPISLIKSIKITSILSKFTPTYWANISLLSLSSNISTNYFYISVSISLGISILLIFTSLIFSKLRVGDNFD